MIHPATGDALRGTSDIPKGTNDARGGANDIPGGTNDTLGGAHDVPGDASAPTGSAPIAVRETSRRPACLDRGARRGHSPDCRRVIQSCPRVSTAMTAAMTTEPAAA